MPFDSLTAPPDVQNAEEIAIVVGMIETIRTPTRWTQGFLVDRTKADPSYCLIGALRFVQSDTELLARKYTPAGKRVAKCLTRLAGGQVALFNDTNDHATVLALLVRVRRHFESTPCS